ncbi:hypothetical protein B0H16DRAFT_1739188 [Mycena metata]|uniref:Uncharacterized protein n=1 Tax=Mycena metata TaxID=1033252 RepID=A0AAD7MK01_9AGAR|nr:hypothetical protein B0H16DRAFT_1739188 [Mycena metata]
MVEKGAYTPVAKSIIRTVAKSGCSQGKVGAVLKAVAQAAGLSVKGKGPSRRTVQRALMEGGVAARIQLAYEMADADGVTLSSDATSLRGENYEGAHVMINKGTSHKMCILSLASTVSHSSETQLENLKHQISTISDIYRRSPLAQRSAFNFEVHDFIRVWKGGNGNHAADVEKFYRLGAAWKRESSRILLGYDEFHRMEPEKLIDVVRNVLKTNLKEVGGEAEWAKLSDKVFETLAEETKREIELFFWAGCSMHKELNCCKAFDDGMKEFYEEHPELDQPVLLANKDNDATIQLAEDTGESTAAVRRALKVSERGGVKLISLFGALVNNKDNKKGLHDVYENYFRATIGPGVRFPDVSNTRYQSHGRGAARLITYLAEHRTFMQFVKDNKTKCTLNHLEQNIMKGLHCPQTISQMVALVLFSMAVMHPYASHVRGPGTEKLNMLDLGPYHTSVKTHMKRLIEDPSPLFSSDPNSYKTATLDGQPWSDTKAWAACVKLFPDLPHVRPLMLDGLKRALERFEKFTTEFDKGGVIDTSTEAERLAGNMPPTNDNNEGLLGRWRKFSRESSSSTVDHFADIVMFHRNDTQIFIDTHMNSEADHRFLRQEARRIDESGVEKARREELNTHKQRAVDEKRGKDAEKAEKVRKEKEQLAAIGLESNRDHIKKMSDAQLKDQLELHRREGDKEIPLKSHMKNKGRRLEELLAALDRFDTRITAQSTVPLP